MHHFIRRMCVVCGGMVMSSGAWASVASYTFTDLGPWSGYAVINDSGTVALGYPGRVWSQGLETTMPGVGNGLGTAASINASGVVAGYSYFGQPAAHHATTWSGGVPLDLGTLGGQNSYALSINDAGLVVGFSSPSVGDNTPRAAFWSGGVPFALDSLGTSYSNALDVNNLGAIVGVSGNRAVRWNGTAVIDLSGGRTSSANAISDAGEIVGFSEGDCCGGYSHAARWIGDVLGVLPNLGGTDSAAHDVNSAGQIVGYASDLTGGYRAVLWTNETIVDLNAFLDADAISDGWHLEGASSINDAGAIVGVAMRGGQPYAFLLSPTSSAPEPQSYTLLLAGLVLLAAVSRRRR